VRQWPFRRQNPASALEQEERDLALGVRRANLAAKNAQNLLQGALLPDQLSDTLQSALVFGTARAYPPIRRD